MDNIYLCDPEKNTECKKTACYINDGPCKCTMNPAYALTDLNGDPIIRAQVSYDTTKEGDL